VVNSRNKGANFEREVINLIKARFPELAKKVDIKRNLDQYQRKDQSDIEFLEFCIECKRYSFVTDGMYKDEWWQQVRRATRDELTPILIFKYDRNPIRVALPLFMCNPDWEKDFHKILVTNFEEFCEILEQYMHRNKLI